MLDTGSTSSVISLEQGQAYRNATGQAAPLRPRLGKIRSLHGQSALLGSIYLRFPLPDNSFSEIEAVVTEGDCPAILGLNDMQRLGCNVCVVTNRLLFPASGVSLPLVHINVHLWLQWQYAEECLFTARELRLLHTRFGHPASDLLASLLKKADPESYDATTLSTLKKISAECVPCAANAPKPRFPKVSVPTSDPTFNRLVIIDILYINGKAVVHIVDRDTKMQAAGFLKAVFGKGSQRESARAVWHVFQGKWSLVYLGNPDIIRHDQGTAFIAEELRAACAAFGIRCAPIAVEAAHQMGEGERYHGPLRRIYEKLELANESSTHRLDDDALLQIAVSAINNSTGIFGLVPTLLVFGAIPKLPIPDSPSAAKSFTAFQLIQKIAMDEHTAEIAQRRLQTAR
jgi:hypothetical protein